MNTAFFKTMFATAVFTACAGLTDSARAESVSAEMNKRAPAPMWVPIAENDDTEIDADINSATFPKEFPFSVLLNVRFTFTKNRIVDNQIVLGTFDRVLLQCNEKRTVTLGFIAIGENGKILSEIDGPFIMEAKPGNFASAMVNSLCPKGVKNT